MKKSLLSIAAVAVALGVNAQTESDFVDVDALGLTSEVATHDALTKLAESENVVMYLANEEAIKSTALTADAYPYHTVVVEGVEYRATKGLTGEVNPSGRDLTNPDAPATGMVIRFDVTKDGWLTVPCKLSSNKPYYVWEGLAGESPVLMSYIYAQCFSSTVYTGLDKLVYELPSDKDGYVDFDAEDISKYTSETAYYWPEQIAIEGYSDQAKVNGLGVISFPVYAEAGKYLFHATGSKVSTDGFIFTEKKPEQIALLSDDGELDLIGNYTTGVSNISVDKTFNENAPVYNVMGQRVAKDTKGILIQNGRKFINK